MLKFRNSLLLILFSAGFIKTLSLPSTMADAFALLVMGTAFCYLEYKNQDKRMAEIEIILKEQKEEIKSVQDKVSSIKVVQQVKPGSLAFRT